MLRKIASDLREFPRIPEPEIYESSGAIEVPLTGFICQIKGGSVRILGYVKRSRADGIAYDNTLIIHMPLRGFFTSTLRGLKHWIGRYGARGAVHLH